MQDDAREVDFQSMHGQHERLTTNKKILEHCEDWQEGGGEGIALHRRVWNVSSSDQASLNGRKMIPDPWTGINRAAT